MGIYDRDYYHDDSEGWWARRAGRQATVGLMIATGVVGLLQLLSSPGPDPLTQWGEFDQSSIRQGQVWRILTPLMLTDLETQYPLWGLAAALIVLYTFGTAVESIYGTREFLAIYLVAGGVAYLAQFLFGLAGFGRDMPAVGCGAAVTAAVVLYACHYPSERWWFFYVIPVPSWALAAGAVGINLIESAQNGGFPRWTAGALFALAYHSWQGRLLNLAEYLPRRGTGRRSTPRLSVYRGPNSDDEEAEPVPAVVAKSGRSAASTRGIDEHLEAKLDQVLEKVLRFGRESLTPEETQILLKASEVYKRRRLEN